MEQRSCLTIHQFLEWLPAIESNPQEKREHHLHEDQLRTLKMESSLLSPFQCSMLSLCEDGNRADSPVLEMACDDQEDSSQESIGLAPLHACLSQAESNPRVSGKVTLQEIRSYPRILPSSTSITRDSEDDHDEVEDNILHHKHDSTGDVEEGIHSTNSLRSSPNAKQLKGFDKPSLSVSGKPSNSRRTWWCCRCRGPEEVQPQTTFRFVLYISSAALLGACVRVYLSRLFGEDCEMEDQAVDDFLTPLSKHICVTSGGRTEHTGGALFRDWPANALGSFLMGLITPHRHHCRLPWFHEDHPLQRDEVFITSMGVGFLGCLTTFASWNSQMVVMMDGTYTEQGPQVLNALFGYLLGFMGCVSSFKFGREVSFWMFSMQRSKSQSRDGMKGGVEKCQSDGSPLKSPLGSSPQKIPGSKIDTPSLLTQQTCQLRSWFRPMNMVHVVVAGVLALFLYGDLVDGQQFYKDMTLMAMAAPLGALIRWKWATWNGGTAFHRRHFPWFPWGTFMANMVGAIISTLCQGLLDRYGNSYFQGHAWSEAAIFAVKVGFAGSLSTVSSLVKEITILEDQYAGQAKSLYYGTFTCLAAMVCGLVIYSATVRL